MTSRLERVIKKNSIFPPLLDLNSCFRSSCCFGRPRSPYEEADEIPDAFAQEVRDDHTVITEQSSGYGSFDTEFKNLPSWAELNSTVDQKKIEVRNFDDVPSTPEPDDIIAPSGDELRSDSVVTTSNSIQQSEKTTAPTEVEVDYPPIPVEVDPEVSACISEKEDEAERGVTVVSEDETSPQISGALSETSPKNVDIELGTENNETPSPGSTSPTTKVKISKKFKLLKKSKKDKPPKADNKVSKVDVIEEGVEVDKQSLPQSPVMERVNPQNNLAQASIDSFRSSEPEKEPENVVTASSADTELPAIESFLLSSLHSSSVDVSDMEGKQPVIEDANAEKTESLRRPKYEGENGGAENGGAEHVEVDGEKKKVKKKGKFKIKFAKKKKKKDLDGRTNYSLPGSTISKSESNVSDFSASKYSAGAILAALDDMSDENIAKE